MRNKVASDSYHSSLCSSWCNYSRQVSVCPKRERFSVLVHQKCSDVCQNVTVLDMADLTSVPTSACVKEHQLPSGAAYCFGEFDSDCPFVFQSGGQGKHQKLMYCYDVILGKWKILGKTTKPHCDHNMHCVNKKLYIIGGRNEGIIEECDVVKKDKREKVTTRQTTNIRGRLKVSVHNFASAVYGDKIFVFGGISNVYPTRCVQYFDTKTGIVSQMLDLPAECQGGVALVIGDAIFIATEQKGLIKFDPMTGVSNFCSNQPVCRKNFAAVNRNNRMYLFGGEEHFCSDHGVNYDEGSVLFSDQESGCNIFIGSDAVVENEHGGLRDCSYDPISDCWKVENSERSLKVAASFVVEYSQPCVFAPFQKDPYTRVHHRCRRR